MGGAKQLVAFALAQAKARGCINIKLDSNENNIASAKVYGSLGFESGSKKWNGGRQILYSRKLNII